MPCLIMQRLATQVHAPKISDVNAEVSAVNPDTLGPVIILLTQSRGDSELQ